MTRALQVLLAVMLVASSAAGHEVGLSHGEYRATPTGLEVELGLARSDAVSLVPALDPDRDGTLVAEDVARTKRDLEQRIASRIRVAAAGQTCPAELVSAELTEKDGLTLRSRHHCPTAAATLGVSVDFTGDLARGHRHAARIVGESTVRDELLYGPARSFELTTNSGRAETPSTAVGFVRMGAEHIASGYDHLLFLLALVLTGGRLRSLLGIVTAFTVGHSLTLAIAALGIWTPPTQWIEPAIALSIGYVAVDNFRKREQVQRWPIALLFGTVHGFGFAGALTDANLPASGILAALFSFNLGVELGQLLALAIALPLVLWLRRSLWFPRFAVPALSGLILVASVGWFIERVAA